ncbi:MAG: N-6 DNA methylase [Bacteroidota bacterium]
MSTSPILTQLDFGGDFPIYPREDDALTARLGADGVYRQDGKPAVFFKEVSEFDPTALAEINALHRRIWNDGRVVFLFVTSPSEIRVYNCYEKPIALREGGDLERELAAITYLRGTQNSLDRLKAALSVAQIDSGNFWHNPNLKPISNQNKVDRLLVKGLLAVAKAMLNDNLPEELIHRLLLRTIFVMYLQDRGAIPPAIWAATGYANFLSLLDDSAATFNFFATITDHFGGNLFPVTEEERTRVTPEHLRALQNCLIHGQTSPSLFSTEYRLFRFDVIRIELLSEIYESFLAEFRREQKDRTGAFYTPPALVELILDQVLPPDSPRYNLRILDPTCGSGIFLAMAFKRLVGIWQRQHPDDRPTYTGLIALLQENIFGMELDRNAVKVTAFSLLLTLLDFLETPEIWARDGNPLPHLTYDVAPTGPQDQLGNNIFRQNAIADPYPFTGAPFDIVVGNPPFGKNGLPPEIKQYCQSRNFSTQFVIPFIHQSARWAPGGKVALLFNTQLLTYTKPTDHNFRNWLFRENRVEKIFNLSIFRSTPNTYGGSLFPDAKVPVSFISFVPEPVEPRGTSIEYWAPQSRLRHHAAEGFVIDGLDVKFIPIELALRSGTNVWKVAQWGNLADFQLVERIQSRHRTLGERKEADGFIFQAGLHKREPNKATVDVTGRFLALTQLQSYYTPEEDIGEIEEIVRHRDLDIFQPPYIALAQNTMEKRIRAAYFDYRAYFKQGMYIVKTGNDRVLRNLTLLFNSSLANYLVFLLAGSWGIERDQTMSYEFENLPISDALLQHPDPPDLPHLRYTSSPAPSLFSGGAPESQMADLPAFEKRVFDAYELGEADRTRITDFLENAIDLFQDKNRARALQPVAANQAQCQAYATRLQAEINDFLNGQGLVAQVSLFRMPFKFPILLLRLEFVRGDAAAAPEFIGTDGEMRQLLRDINRYSVQQYAQSVYLRKKVRYSTGDTLYLAQPNQRRYWTQSRARDEAQAIISEMIAANV